MNSPPGSFRFAAALAALLLLVSPGCEIVRFVEISSRPPETTGASIYVNGEKRGSTPAKVRLDFPDPNARVLVQVVKANYKPAFQYWTLHEVPERRPFDLEDE